MQVKSLRWGLAILTVYLATRLVNLTLLPVFADEAIYIRWAQLMNQDFQRYAFFPLQDGKPPLYMWILTQVLPYFPNDPLWGARLVGVICGAVNLFGLGYLLKITGRSALTQKLGMGLYLVLPFTLWYDRMAVIDNSLTMWLLLSLIGLVLILKGQGKGGLIMGIGMGLALWTKTSSLFFIPVLLIIFLCHRKKGKTQWLELVLGLGLALFIFAVLLISPSFPALFSRSQDFTFSFQELLRGDLDHIPGNLFKLVRWLATYTTIPVAISILFPIGKRSRTYLLGIIIFSLPFIILGRVISTRYFLPLIILIIPLAADMLTQIYRKQRLLLLGIGLAIVFFSLKFMLPSLFNPGATPLVREDEVQYLTEWSAGYGIPEVRDFIRKEAVIQPMVVATEGYFGTLPDGLFMYFADSPLLVNLEIYGIGQPIGVIPISLVEKAKEKPTYLVVNSHRFLIDPLPETLELIAKYPRPHNGPSLLLFKVRPKV